jgi:hypothetical protein
MSMTKRYLESLPTEEQNAILGEVDPDYEPEYRTTLKDWAAEEVEAIITDCESVLNAARDIKLAIEARDAKAIRTGLKTLHDHTDGYWNRLVLGHGTEEMYALAEEIEET